MENLFKKVSSKFNNKEFSKRLVFIVTGVWLLATIANYVLNYFGMSVDSMGMTYGEITSVFKVILLYYFSKASVENFTKIKGSLDNIMEDVASELNTKNK